MREYICIVSVIATSMGCVLPDTTLSGPGDAGAAKVGSRDQPETTQPPVSAAGAVAAEGSGGAGAIDAGTRAGAGASGTAAASVAGDRAAPAMSSQQAGARAALAPAAGSGGLMPGHFGTAGTVAAGVGSTPSSTTPTLPAKCLDGITDYASAGPFTFELKAAGQVKLWVPALPAGCKAPVVELGLNTSFGMCSSYQELFERLASHGFIAACYEEKNSGGGTEGVAALEAALQMLPDLADHKFGTTGQFEGGQSAFTALQLAEDKWGSSFVYAGLAIEPASGFGTQPAGGAWQQVYAKIKSPMFMFNGSVDNLVSASWVQQAFDATAPASEAFFWTAVGAMGMPPPFKAIEQVAIAWFRWKLLGDLAACRYFKQLPDTGEWTVQKERNAKACGD